MAPGFLKGIIDALFPEKCVFCRKVLKSGENDVCSGCNSSLPFTSGGDVVHSGEYYEKCACPLYYSGDVVDSIHRYKFKGYNSYAGSYGTVLAKCISDNLKGDYNLISWVPLSAERKKERGYDQAMLLALAAALELDDVAVETLRKTSDIPAQSGIDDQHARKVNVSGVYQPADPELIQGKRILMIDDVVTTGSTLSECAKVLLQAGASSVVCAALAFAKRS